LPIVTAQQRQRRQQGQQRQEKNWQTYWHAPRLWPNGTVYILGGGPSLKLVDVDRLRGRHVIAVNNAYQLGDWIDVCYFGDKVWYFNMHHKNKLLNFAGLKVTTCAQCEKEPGIKVIRKRNSPWGISRDQHIVCWNKSSGGCAINLATLFGAKKIILFGYDMRKIEDAHNWHWDHEGARTQRKINKNPYSTFLEPFDYIAKGLQRDNIECINATPGSALTHFPIVEPESII
jgi:hypothetical protein